MIFKNDDYYEGDFFEGQKHGKGNLMLLNYLNILFFIFLKENSFTLMETCMMVIGKKIRRKGKVFYLDLNILFSYFSKVYTKKQMVIIMKAIGKEIICMGKVLSYNFNILIFYFSKLNW